MSWYDPLKLNSRKWSELSATGKKIYVIYYLILISFLGVMLWVGEFSEEAKTRNQQELLEWQESRKNEEARSTETLN
tara:strand:+ start:1872 stop:2102 length:231 start_codon:yes stop_codon:yes gene_type:complete